MFAVFSILFVLISIFWLARIVKQILFWTYLWQLKEYHMGRFLAHFQTEQGRRLVVNRLLFAKFVLLLFFWTPIFRFIVLLLYFLEAGKFAHQVLRNKVKRPVLTKKTGIILFFAFIVFAVGLIFLYQETPLQSFCLWLLVIDIAAPIIVSLIVLGFQPFAVLARNYIIRKAVLKREMFKDLLVIGITGSYGKTSTKEFLYAILSEKFGRDRVVKTREHQNSEIGISRCILNDLKKGVRIFICEMGAYNRGGIRLLCNIAKPSIGILTGINEQHMATFGSQENIIKTKFELVESLPEAGIAVLNKDSRRVSEHINQVQGLANKIVKFYSAVEKCDVWAEDIKAEKASVGFKVRASDDDSADFRVELLGQAGVLNVLGACACAKGLGVGLKDCARACARVKPLPGSGRLVKSKQGFNIIDAAYSANPASVIMHLDHMKAWKGRKAIVMPCLIELGGASEDVHQRIGAKIGRNCDLAIITKKECFENIKRAAVKAGLEPERILFLQDPLKIFKELKSFNNTEDVILLESRAPKGLADALGIGA